MTWENPYWFYALWIVPAFAVLLIYAHRRRIATASQFVDPKMVKRLMPMLDPWRPWLKGTLLLAGIALLIMAMARPRFGVDFKEVQSRGVDLFVLLDVSRSMLAEDIAPNRLERAKLDIRDLLNTLPGDRVGLIAFAGAAVVQVPLTTDRGFFLMALDDVDTDSAPRGGSLIGDAIRKGIESMEDRRDRDQVMVLITDGEDHDSFPEEAAKQAKDRDIKIFAVGLGDVEEGMRIPIRDESGRLRYLKHEGQEVWSRMDELLMKQIAMTTDGKYIPAKTRAYDLGQIYEDHLAELTRGEIQSEKRERRVDQFQLFICLGLALLMTEMLVSPYPRPAVRHAARVPGTTSTREPRVATIRAGLMLSILLFMPTVVGAGTGDAIRHVQRGIRHFREGDYEAAQKAFSEADVALPENERIAFNQACALAAQNDVDKATELFQQAALARDTAISASSHFNLGCLATTKAKTIFGEKPEEAAPEVRGQGLSQLAQAVSHYRDCLNVDQNHAAARHNLEVIRLWIKQMQDLWAQRDRDKRREEMNLLEFLEMIQDEQIALRQTSRSLLGEDDSPKRRQAISQTESQQRSLAEEVDPLKEKIRKAFQTPAGHGGTAGGQPAQLPDAGKAIDVLGDVADRGRKAMTRAGDRLGEEAMNEAIQAQADALDSLNDIYTTIVPFSRLLAKATATEQLLVDQSTDIVEKTGEESPQVDNKSIVDFDELARNQLVVNNWSKALPIKAEQEQKQLEAQPPDAAPGSSDLDTDAKETIELREGLVSSLKKAIELCPKIEELTKRATDHLGKRDAQSALPDQQESLKLLKEIAESLPKQQQEQNQDGDQNEEKQNENIQDQHRDQSVEKEKPRPQRDLSRQQAEAVLRKVRERERDYRERQKQLRQFRHAGATVDRDW